MTTLAVAAMQLRPVTGDRAATLAMVRERVLALVEDFPHVRLVVLPELLLCAEPPFGRRTAAATPAELAEPIPGPMTEALGTLAAEAGVWLVPGSIYESADGAVYNTTPVIAPDGRVTATYRKVFPWHPFEQTEPGDEFVVVRIDDIMVGLAICFDGSFPETVRQLAWLGAEVVVQPTLTPTRDRTQELVLARANAIANQVWLVNVNGAAPVGVGESVVVDPEGVVRQQAGATEEVLVEVLDLDAVRRARRYGAAGMTRPWALLADRARPVRLPAYGGSLGAPPWAAGTADESNRKDA